MKKRFTKDAVLSDIERNHNHCWFDEIKLRAHNKSTKTALQYRGTEITYNDYINTCEKIWAPALKVAGISKGTEVVISISSTPEFCYLFGAISIVGAKVNIVSDEFDKEYIAQICNKASSEYIFVGEDRFNELIPTFAQLNNKTIVPIPLDFSLTNGNPFADITDRFLQYDKGKYIKNIATFSNIESLDDFLARGKEYSGIVKEISTLDDEFTITYSSGTTDGNKPKGIVHSNRHYIVMGRYHDAEVSGIPNLKNSITFSTIPTQSNSYIASILSDTLMEGACIALEPIVSKEYFIYGIKVNNPYMAIATTSSWLYAAKYYYSLDKKERNKFKFAKTIFPVVVGEPMSAGEEKFLNRFIRDTKCGIAITKLPFSFSKMSICGGDCEHGSLFMRVLRAYANLKRDKIVKEPIGLRTYDFVDIKVLRRDGTYCDTYEYGRLVANSACTMIGYKDEPERTQKFFIKDADGKTWADLGCYGYLDNRNNIYIKGRMSEDTSVIPEFTINDEIQQDSANILSSSVVCCVNNGEEVYIAYIEQQLFTKTNSTEIISNAILRCKNKFGEDFIKKLYISIVDHKKSFPLTGCLKRDNNTLRELGLTDSCIKATDLLN